MAHIGCIYEAKPTEGENPAALLLTLARACSGGCRVTYGMPVACDSCAGDAIDLDSGLCAECAA